MKANQNFKTPDAVVKFGVGKNMVSSIKYWLRAFDILDDNDKLMPLSEKLLSNDGWDPFLEDEASLWILHYLLCRKGFYPIYHQINTTFKRAVFEIEKM